MGSRFLERESLRVVPKIEDEPEAWDRQHIELTGISPRASFASVTSAQWTRAIQASHGLSWIFVQPVFDFGAADNSRCKSARHESPRWDSNQPSQFSETPSQPIRQLLRAFAAIKMRSFFGRFLVVHPDLQVSLEASNFDAPPLMKMGCITRSFGASPALTLPSAAKARNPTKISPTVTARASIGIFVTPFFAEGRMPIGDGEARYRWSLHSPARQERRDAAYVLSFLNASR